MREASADKQSAVAPALDGESWGGSVFIFDQPLGGSNVVVEDILFFGFDAGLVPRLSVFAAPAEVGHGKDATQLHPDKIGDAEGRGQADVKSAVAVEQCWG